MPRKTPPMRKNDCLTQCLSTLLNINYEEVPFYAKESAAKNWLSKLSIWANKKGYKMRVVYNPKNIWPTHKVIGVGRSPSGKDNDHAVIVDIICDTPKVIWDPTYNKRRSVKQFGYFITFRKIND